MNSTDSIKTLLAASGGDTVKLFDISVEPRDPCILNYTPSPGFHVNSIKWNHTSEYNVHNLFSFVFVQMEIRKHLILICYTVSFPGFGASLQF